jgi:nucleoside-diphosphate-sugar epimerase
VSALVRDICAAQRILGVIPELELIQCDLFDAVTLQRAVENVDSVFHLAAKVHTIPRTESECHDFFKVNVEGTQFLLDACTNAAVGTFIFFSTIAVFGHQPSPFSENTPLMPATSYAKSKYEAENIVRQWFERTKAHVVILRPSMVFGEGDRGNFLRMVRAVDKGRFLTFGRARKSLAYSENVAEIAIVAACTPLARGEVLIVSDPHSYTVHEIAQHIATALGRRIRQFQLPIWPLRVIGTLLDKVRLFTGIKMPFSSNDVLTLANDAVCDTAKLHGILNLQPQYCLSVGIARTVDWYRTSQKL